MTPLNEDPKGRFNCCTIDRRILCRHPTFATNTGSNLPQIPVVIKVAHGLDIVANITTKHHRDIQNVHDHRMYEQRLSYIRFNLKSRLLASDDTCMNACEDDVVSSFQASGSLVEETEDEDASRGIFGRLTGLFDGNQNIFSRLMHGLFRLFNRSQEDDPKYLIPTDTILPLISNYSTKVKSLAAMMRQEGVKDAALSKTPDAILMMYNISAENIESVATVLDPILVDLQQHETLDVRTISCNMMQILTLLRDVTVPNIELMAQLIYTKSNNGEMKDRFNQYTKSTGSAASSTTSTSTSSSEDGTCLIDASSTTLTSKSTVRDRFFDLLDFLFDPCIEIGPVTHVLSNILLLVVFPISILVSFVSTTILIFYLLADFLRSILGLPDNSNDGYEGIILDYVFTVTILAPLIVAVSILRNVRGFVEDLFDPFLPNPPTENFVAEFPSPIPIDPQINVPTDAPILRRNTIRRDISQISDVNYHISILLDAPIEAIIAATQSERGFSNGADDDDTHTDIHCDISSLICNNNALLNTLPF